MCKGEGLSKRAGMAQGSYRTPWSFLEICGTPEHPGARSWGRRGTKSGQGGAACSKETLLWNSNFSTFWLKYDKHSSLGRGCNSRKSSQVSKGVSPSKQWEWLQMTKPNWECERHRALEQMGFKGPLAFWGFPRELWENIFLFLKHKYRKTKGLYLKTLNTANFKAALSWNRRNWDIFSALSL